MTSPMPEKPKKIRRPLTETVPNVILAVLAVAGLVISGWSLGSLLHDTAGAPWPVAIFAVAVFDLVAMAATLLVYQRRHDPWAAGGARLTMTGALLASAVVNGAHGLSLGGWTTAVVLAAAPLSFEVVFELRHRTLTALIWILFRKEAMHRLKLDAWSRIRPPDPVTADPDVPEIRIARNPDPDPRSGPSGGSAKAKVHELAESGVTDPDELVRQLPDYNAESVRRYARALKNGAPA